MKWKKEERLWNGLTMESVFDDALDDKEYEGNIFTLLENTKQSL